YHNVVNESVLRRMLRSPDYHARAAATRVLRYWHDRVPDALHLLATQIHDEHPRVRLMAILALSDFQTLEAVKLALEVVKHPMDYYLQYSLKETIAALEPYWKPAILSGKSFAADPASVHYLLANVSTADLVRIPKSAAICLALLSREGVLHEHRHEALSALAELNKTDETTQLLALLERTDRMERSQ